MPVVKTPTSPSPRARAIARGLIETGRGIAMQSVGGFMRVRAESGADYWVSYSGNALLRGEAPETAEELQAGFVNTMAKAGARS